MAPRRKPAAPTYAQLFGDGSGTSSSGPSSSNAVPNSQTSQRVFPSPPLPPQMPPPPPPAAAPEPVPEGAVHPDLRVPSYAPFARYTRKNTPNHRSCPHPTLAPLRDLCHHPRSPQSCLLQSHRRFLPLLPLDRARPYAFSGVSLSTTEETSRASVSNSVEHSSPAVTAAQGLRTTEDASIEASSKLLESLCL
uniref:Uncharacterized protein n=1 Tax=Brassica oleracea var. oleracea TaxID=109376 RepID=A0A0D3DP38_BRAOL